MRRIALLLLILPLAACGLFPSKQNRALRRSPDYQRRLSGRLQQRLVAGRQQAP